MHRLLVPTEILQSDNATLPPEAAHHLKVVRPKNGETIELFDGAGAYRTYRFCADQSGRFTKSASVCLSAVGDVAFASPRAASVTLFACITKGARWDWTIEKATELGVSRIVPVLSSRCIVHIGKDERGAKQERWRRIAEEAARQSDAKWLPEITEAVDFREALALAEKCKCFVGALTQPPSAPLLESVQKCIAGDGGTGDYGLFVGPEGDFTADELGALLKIAHPTSFGPTILRAETAAMFGIAVLSAALSSNQ